MVLLPQHEAYLIKRAVPVDWAVWAGYRSVSREEGGRLLGRTWKALPSGGFWIPYSIDGYGALRLDKPLDGLKFMMPSRYVGGSSRPYVPPSIPGEVLSNPAVSLAILEGPVKAASFVCAGIPAIGLAGCSGGGHDRDLRHGTGRTQLHEVLRRRIVWAGRTVLIVMDSNAWWNKNVQNGEKILVDALHAAGAHPVIARTPPPNPLCPVTIQWGPDDWLAARGRDAVLAHLDKSRTDPSLCPQAFSSHGATVWPSRMVEFLNAALPPGARKQAKPLYEEFLVFCKVKGWMPLKLTGFSLAVKAETQYLGLKKGQIEGRFFWTRPMVAMPPTATGFPKK